jgi:hypothetical protein
MRWCALAALALCVAPGGRVGFAQDTVSSAGGRTIRGIVVDGGNEAPLRRVTLLVTAGGTRVASTATASDGTFVLSLPDTTDVVRIKADKAGYATAVAEVRAPARGIATEMRIVLVKGAAISGRIVERSNDIPPEAAAVGVGVTRYAVDPVLRRVTADGTFAPASPASVTLPSLMDPEGWYRFGGLPAGRYAVGYELRPPNAPPVTALQTMVEVAAGQDLDGVDVMVPARQFQTPAATPGRAGSATIRGRVSGRGGETLGAAVVVAIADGEILTVATDVQGRFVFNGMTAGSFRLNAAKIGYVSATPTSVTVADGEQTDNIELVLAGLGVISGRVTDEFDEPVQNARVRINAIGDRRNNFSAVSDPLSSALTDDRGEFRVAGVTPGLYVVSAAAPDLAAAAGEAYVPMYYGGTRDRTFASPVDVEPAAHVTGIAVRLRPVPVGRISGVAVTASGGVANGTVRLLAPGQTQDAFEARSVVAGPGGEFAFSGVPTGTYLVEMILTGSGGRELASEQITITDVEQPPLVLRARRGATLAGRILLDGGAGRPIQGYSMKSQRLAGESSRPGDSHTFSGSIADGTSFSMTDLWGPTRLLFSSPDEGWYLDSVVINGTDATDEPFDFGLEGRAFADAEVTFAANPASIAGRAVDERGAAFGGVAVLVFPVDSRRWFADSRWLESVTADASGSFALDGLPPGEYHVAAVAGLDRSERQLAPELLHELVGVAARVSAAPATRQTITLRAIRRLP